MAWSEYEITKKGTEKHGVTSTKVDGAVSKYRPPTTPPPRGVVRKFSLYPFLFSMTIWTVLGVWAYNVWKTKEEVDEEAKVINDQKYFEKEGFVQEQLKKRVQKRTGEAKGFMHFQDDKVMLPTNTKLQVSVNDEYERIEVIKRTLFGWRVRTVEFENMERDEDGKFVFDERGLPVRKGNFLQILGQYLRHRNN